MYEELIRSCRACATGYVGNCDNCMFSGKDCYKQLHKASADAIEELSKPKWIPVTERLPKDGEFVLVCNDDKHMMIAKYETETYEWYYKYTNYDFDIWDNEEQGPVCYWMPLPEPPKEEET